MKKIKVLFTLPNLKTAGSGREMINIIEQLDKNQFEAWVGVQEIGGALFDEVIAKKIPIVVQPFLVKEGTPAFTVLKQANELAKNFKDLAFDLWVSFNWSSDFSEAVVAKRAGAKYLYVKKNMNWERKAWKTKSFLSSAIVARNKTMMETIFTGKKYQRKVHLVHGGVDTRIFTPGFDMSVRRDLDIPDNAFMACCVAQIIRSKDQATLIKAVSKIENVYVVLAGAIRDEAFKKELDELVKQLKVSNRVVFAGAVKNVNSLLNASNVFVLPTSTYKNHEEGCPVSVLEAMAAGTTCIVSDVAGSRDLVTHGKTGLIFQPEKVDQLADCIRELINKPSYPKTLAENAMDEVYRSYTIQKEAANFATLFKKLAKAD